MLRRLAERHEERVSIEEVEKLKEKDNRRTDELTKALFAALQAESKSSILR